MTLDKYVNCFENVQDKVFVENFIRMEKWIFDSPDVPGETFSQFIKDCFQDNLLIQSKMELGGKRVDLQNLIAPLLNIYGRFDHLVPPVACELLTNKVGGKDTEDLCLETGHIGIYVSAKCQKELAPKIAGWLLARDDKEGEAAAPTPACKDDLKLDVEAKTRTASTKKENQKTQGG
jgi:polyhydroxyalkanoate synthase subunit PhaC